MPGLVFGVPASFVGISGAVGAGRFTCRGGGVYLTGATEGDETAEASIGATIAAPSQYRFILYHFLGVCGFVIS